MPVIHTELRSVGPNAVGQGTWYRRDVLSPDRSAGVITKWLGSDINQAADLVNEAQGTFETTFPGDANLPLRQVNVRLFEAGYALGVGTYARGGGKDRFVTQLEIVPAGFRTYTSYTYPELAGVADDEIPEHYLDEHRFLKPRQIEVPLYSVRWRQVLYSDQRPTLHPGLVGKLNNATYTIDGYSFAKGTLRFDGESIRHDKYAAYDRWYLTFEASHDVLAWQNEALTGDPPGTITLVNERPDTDYVTFPNLP